MIKVLRIINRFNLGGPTYNAALLTKHLPADRYETLLVGGEKDESEGSSLHITQYLGLDPIIIPEMKREISPKDDYKSYKRICNLIEEFKPDIVHTHASKAGTVGRLAARKMKVPGIVHTFHGHVFHSYFSKAKTTFYKHIEKRLAKSSSKIIAISDIQKHELGTIHKICPPEKISVIPLGFDLTKFKANQEIKRNLFRSKYKIKDNEIAVGIIGRLVPIKNHELFLNAASTALQKTSQKVKFFIVGDGELMNCLLKKADELNFVISKPGEINEKANLFFTSWITDMDHVVAGVDLVALSSKNEGTPVSLIEAQAGNRSVISTNVGGIENVIENGKTGLLSKNEDVQGFADNLLTLLEDHKLRQELGENGWVNVGQRFHYDRLANNIDQLYTEILNK